MQSKVCTCRVRARRRRHQRLLLRAPPGLRIGLRWMHAAGKAQLASRGPAHQLCQQQHQPQQVQARPPRPPCSWSAAARLARKRSPCGTPASRPHTAAPDYSEYTAACHHPRRRRPAPACGLRWAAAQVSIAPATPFAQQRRRRRRHRRWGSAVHASCAHGRARGRAAASVVAVGSPGGQVTCGSYSCARQAQRRQGQASAHPRRGRQQGLRQPPLLRR